MVAQSDEHGEHAKRCLGQGKGAHLSKSAFAYATKEIEVEEVNFSIEINGLMSSKKDISEQGTWSHMWAMNCAVPFVCSIRHPLERGRTKGRD
jgi:hypothetical protein